MSSPNRVRQKGVYYASGTTRTITFDEPTALDSTHLLVCIVHYTTSTAPSPPSGWTEVGSNTGLAPSIVVWLKQGDGSTNSITWTSANGVGSGHLLAYTGYSSLTPLVAFTATQVVTAINPWTFADPATVTGYGVAFNIAASTAQAMAGTTPVWGAPWANIPAASTSARGVQADDEYIDGAGDQSTTVTLSATRTGYSAQIVIPLVASTSVLAFRNTYVNVADQASYTYTAAPIGTASATRRVIVGIATNSTRTITAVTIGGITATLDAVQTLAGTAHMVLASAVVPTGTTADVVVTLDTIALGIGMAVWTGDGLTPTGQTGTGNGDPTAMSVTTVSGDAVVAYVFAVMGVATGQYIWSDGYERFDEDVYSTTTTHSGSDKIATGTTTTFSTSTANATTLGIAAAYGTTGPQQYQVAGTAAVVTDVTPTAIGQTHVISYVDWWG